MARPRKGTEETWFDTFAEWDEADRAAALKVLDHLHRALIRAARNGKQEIEQSEQIKLTETKL